MGEGTVLYFKFLKYFMAVFLLAFGISVPSLLMYTRGLEYSDVKDAIKEVGSQLKDVGQAAKGKKRSGRKPKK